MSVFILLAAVLSVAALVAFGVRAARGTRPPTGHTVYGETLAAVPDDVAATVINYLGGRLDSPACNFATITETNADGSLRYRANIRTNPTGQLTT